MLQLFPISKLHLNLHVECNHQVYHTIPIYLFISDHMSFQHGILQQDPGTLKITWNACWAR